MTDPDPQRETAARNLVDVTGPRADLVHRGAVDALDRRVETDRARDMGEADTQAECSRQSGAGQSGETPPVGLGGELEDLSPTSGGGDHREGGQLVIRSVHEHDRTVARVADRDSRGCEARAH